MHLVDSDMDRLLCDDSADLCVVAPVSGGKTEFLVRKAARAVGQGADAGDILCLASSPDAAARLRERLVARDERLRDAVVRTPFQLCGDVLRHGGARLLVRGEEDCATPGFSDDGSPERAGTAGRSGVLDAVLPDDAPARAAEYLRNSPDGGLRGAYRTVLVDDAQNLSPAMLETCRLLSCGQFVVCGNPDQAVPGFCPGEDPAAFESGSDTVHRLRAGFAPPATIARLCGALLGDRAAERAELADASNAARDGDGSVVTIKWRDPEDEFEGIARIVRRMVSAGKNGQNGASESVFVAVADPYWGEGVRNALADRGVDAVLALPTSVTDAALEQYCLLALAADQGNGPAWRLWHRLGRDACAHAWQSFEAWALNSCTDMDGALDTLRSVDAMPFEGARVVRERVEEGLEAASMIRRRRGFGLVKALGAKPGDGGVRDLLGPLEGDEGPDDLLAAMRDALLQPAIRDGRHQVVVGAPRFAQGLSFDHVVVAGILDTGRSDDLVRRELYNLVGKARRTVFLSTVQYVEKRLAEHLGIATGRERLVRGKRLCTPVRSGLLDEAAGVGVGTWSGEQYLAVR